MKRSAFAAATAVLALFVLSPISRADLLKGTTVYGTLNIDGSSTNDFGSSAATVGPGVEFSYMDDSFQFIVGTCDYAANLSNAKIAIKDVCSTAISEVAAIRSDLAKPDKPSFVLTLTDTALDGDTIAALKNGLGLDFSLSGDVLTFDFTGGHTKTNKSTFSVAASTPTSVTPEPASWQLLALGLAGAFCMARFGKSRLVGANAQSL